MLNLSQSAGKNSLFYLVGVYLGDGCVTRYGRGSYFKLNTIDYDFALATQDALYKIIGRRPKIYTYPVKKSKKPNNQLSVCCKELCDYLQNITNKKKRIPQFIINAGKSNKLEFIAGLMDSEGYVALRKWNKKQWSGNQFIIGFKSTDYWVGDFKGILQSVGVIVTSDRKEKPRKSWYKIPRVLTLSLPSFIKSGCYFKISRKQNRINTYIDAKKCRISLRDYMLDSQ